MRWQKTLRLAIAAFVVIFAAVVALSLRRGPSSAPAESPAGKKLANEVVTQGGSGSYEHQDKGKVAYSIKFGSVTSYADGRQKLGGGVTAVLPDKNGRRVTIESREADVTVPPGKQIGTGEFTGGVR